MDKISPNFAKEDAAKRQEVFELVKNPEFVKENPAFAKEVLTWKTEEKDHFVQKGFRAIRQDELPMVSSLVRPTDYNNDLKRGTVNHHDEWRNYSFHTVNIEDGTIVMNRNFCQVQPGTDAIVGENLMFVECNLVNVAIHPSWTLVDCNNAQVWFIETNGKDEREYICAHPNKLPDPLIPPQNVLLSRDF